MRQILSPSGAVSGDPPVGLDMTLRLFRAMVFARAYDRKSMALQRQGRLATYAPFEGQEASQVGAAAALDPDDWLIATYRDAAAMWMQGYPLELLFAGRTGHEVGGSPPDHVNVMPPSITVGGHMVHAVGIALAERMQGSRRIAMTMFGDGATSEGDFHEAMNFAGVYAAPVVFFCQNNGWAISLPRSEQTASESIAEKAIAYGMPGVQVDGNDLYAVHAATREAVKRARDGGGPTLIEAVTYRIGPHTTADDPTRYRDEEDVEDWSHRDPLERVRILLSEHGQWTREWQDEVERAAAQSVERAISLAEELRTPDARHLFGAVFETQTPDLAAQQAEVERLRGDA